MTENNNSTFATEKRIEAVFTFAQYHNEDNSWCVHKFRRRDNDREIVAVGAHLPDRKNLPVVLVGEWAYNPKNGKKQFKVDYVEQCKPSKENEVVAFLGSLRCGIGPIKAKAVYRKFGDRTFDVIDNEPERLLEVRSISVNTVERLKEALLENNASRDLLKLFSLAGITVSGKTIHDMVERFREGTVRVITENPFVAIGMDGYSFDKADAVAATLNMPLDHPYRLEAAVVKVLDDAAFQGHVCLPKDIMLKEFIRYTRCSDKKCRQALNDAYKSGKIKKANNCIFKPERFDCEASIAGSLVRLMRTPLPPISHIDALIEDYERINFPLADSQKDAIHSVFQNPVSIITGGPGVGKTTVIKAILYVHGEVFGESLNPVLLAPTGRAARRMSEATNFPATTIHSAVGWKGDNHSGEEDRQLNGNLFIVDEASMMDQNIANILLRAIPNDARVVFVGDPDQLPSVGCGNVLADMIRSGAIPTTKLSVIFRQAQENPIVKNAHAINSGESKLTYSRTFRFYESDSESAIFNTACSFFCRCVKAYGLDNVVLLNPQRNNTDLSVDRFNVELQSRLNPPAPDKMEIKIGKSAFREGDKVMELKNTEIAKNGDTGYIREIIRTPDPQNEGSYQFYANIEFNGDGKILEYNEEDLRHITLAYCMTVHKSQGSEYQTVIMIISKAHPSMLKRNLVYTGVTRAKENVCIFGEHDALDIAVSNAALEVRYTLLANRLSTMLGKTKN